MRAFGTLDAVAVPLRAANMDTDQIIPARFLWRRRQDGFGELLFHDLRHAEDGTRRQDFVLDRPEYAGAEIIVAGKNFGCGSSREAAVWALADAGVRAVIAPSFGDIFFNNSLKNGLLPVILAEARVAGLRAALEAGRNRRIVIDLAGQRVTGPDGEIERFEIDPFGKQLLLAGLDELSLTLREAEKIAAFEREYEREIDWL
ncbi:MAG: 3-isopropylmalate dehydratase small subunit [Acetobacteraceae bacterium]